MSSANCITHTINLLHIALYYCTRWPMLGSARARAEALSYSAVKLFSNLCDHGT